MPTYEFKCNCGELIEKKAEYGTKEILCECGSNAKKILSIPNIQFKGKDFTLSK